MLTRASSSARVARDSIERLLVKPAHLMHFAAMLEPVAEHLDEAINDRVGVLFCPHAGPLWSLAIELGSTTNLGNVGRRSLIQRNKTGVGPQPSTMLPRGNLRNDLVLRWRKQASTIFCDKRHQRRPNMKNIRINADEALWQNNMLPEGILERWLVSDGEVAREGHAIAEVRIEGAVHDIVAPATGRLSVSASARAVIEPGFLLATLTVDTSATEIAKLHLDAAISAAASSGIDDESICRALLGLVVSRYLQSRTVSDVQSELRFVAENCAPDTDFMFMRP